jgi:hypothetical protein
MLIMVTENYVEHEISGGSSSSSREDSSSDGEDVFTAFVSAIPSKGTKKEYLIRLRYFFGAIHVPGKILADQASNFLSQIVTAKFKPKIWSRLFTEV